MKTYWWEIERRTEITVRVRKGVRHSLQEPEEFFFRGDDAYDRALEFVRNNKTAEDGVYK